MAQLPSAKALSIGDRPMEPATRIETALLFRWSDGSGMSALVQPPSPAFSGAIEPNDWSTIKAVSGNGNAILFDRQRYGLPAPDGSRTVEFDRYVWSAEARVESPPLLIDAFAFFNSLSADGGKRAGWVGVDMYRIGGPNSQAAVIDFSGSITGLGWLPGSLPNPPGGEGPMSKATAMSNDTSVVVGLSTSTNAPGLASEITLGDPSSPGQFPIDRYEAFVWSHETGMVGLGDLPGGVFNSGAINVSPGGDIVIGISSVEGGTEAFRWTGGSGMRGLGFLNPELKQSAPTAITNDGTIVGSSLIGREIVGHYEFTNEPIYKDTLAAFIWDAAHGMRNLQSVLESNYGLDLSGWQLTSAVDISDDGRVIAGNGINPLGQEEAWSCASTLFQSRRQSQCVFSALVVLFWLEDEYSREVVVPVWLTTGVQIDAEPFVLGVYVIGTIVQFISESDNSRRG